MELRSVSASSLHVAELCPARFATEYVSRIKGSETVGPGTLGTAVHGALEDFVRTAVIEKTTPYELPFLLMFYDVHFRALFGYDRDTWYEDGKQMLERWFYRTSWEGVTVESLEQKKTFPVFKGEDLGFTYILDRRDLLDSGDRRVVDYKTIRVPLSVGQIRSKIQTRAYSAATRIEFPDSERIFVMLDMLRHDFVGTFFTRADDIEFIKWLRGRVRDLQNTAHVDAMKQERVNSECGYCPRIAGCGAVRQARDVGVLDAMTTDDIVRAYGGIKDQIKALEKLGKDMDERIVAAADDADLVDWTVDNYRVEVSGKMARRAPDTVMVERVVGADILLEYGTLTVGATDKLLKDTRLSDVQRDQIKKIMGPAVLGEKLTAKVTTISELSEVSAL